MLPVLNPVILAVPPDKTGLAGREKARFLSAHARIALDMSARYSRMPLGELCKDEHGAPLASNGVFWSITHKRHYVGGVVSIGPVGIDIEEIKPRHPGMFKKVGVPEEWHLSDREPFHVFYRYWTAKEAVIKAWGDGIKDLLKIRVVEIPDEYNLVVRFGGKIRHVEHCYFDRHMAAIVKDGFEIRWRIETDQTNGGSTL